MANQAAVRPEISWEGGTSPFQVSWQKLMMWFFLVSDALLFAGFLVAYGYVRLSSDSWPDQGEVFTMALIGVMTFVLITSSATMASAVGGARDGDLIRARKFVIMTAVGGVLFLGMQAFEWTTLISEGATLTQNPWGVKGFSVFFLCNYRFSRNSCTHRDRDSGYYGSAIGARSDHSSGRRTDRIVLAFC